MLSLLRTGMERKKERLFGVLGNGRPGSASKGRFRMEHAPEGLVVLVFSFAGLMALSLRTWDHSERFPEEVSWMILETEFICRRCTR